MIHAQRGLCICGGEVRIERKCFPEERYRFLTLCGTFVAPYGYAAQIIVVSVPTLRRLAFDLLGSVLNEPRSDCARDARRYHILQIEYVVHFAFEFVGPKVRTRRGFNE